MAKTPARITAENEIRNGFKNLEKLGRVRDRELIAAATAQATIAVASALLDIADAIRESASNRAPQL